jgi:chromosomal replication initiation ATPase DnaA
MIMTKFHPFDKDLILKETSNFYGVEVFDVKSKTRKREIVIPRQASMYMMKELIGANISLKLIGKAHGDRDHSTVIHAIQSINDLMDIDFRFKRRIADLKAFIKEKKKEWDEKEEMRFKFEGSPEVNKNLEVLQELKPSL